MHASISTLHRSLCVPPSSFISSLSVVVSYDRWGVRRERLTVDVERLPSLSPHPPSPPPPSPPPPLATVRSPLYTIRTLSPITLLVAPPPPSPPTERPSAVTLPPSPPCDIDMSTSSSPSSSPSSLSLSSPPLTPTLPLPSVTPPPPSTSSPPLSPPSTQPLPLVSDAVSVTPLPLPAVSITSPPLSLPSPSSSSPLPPSSSTRTYAGEKRGKESSDEDGEEKKAEVVATQAMIDEYNLLKNKRQKLKERKARARQRKAEDDPERLLLPGDLEQQRVAVLRHVNPSPEEVDRAVKGQPTSHPLLLRLLASCADFLRQFCDEDTNPLFTALVRRQFLSPSPFSLHALTALCIAEGITFSVNPSATPSE